MGLDTGAHAGLIDAHLSWTVDPSVREQLILSAIVAVCGIDAPSKNRLLDELTEMLIMHNHPPHFINR